MVTCLKIFFLRKLINWMIDRDREEKGNDILNRWSETMNCGKLQNPLRKHIKCWLINLFILLGWRGNRRDIWSYAKLCCMISSYADLWSCLSHWCCWLLLILEFSEIGIEVGQLSATDQQTILSNTGLATLPLSPSQDSRPID